MNAEIRTRTLLGESLVRGLRDLAILCLVLFGMAGRVDWPAAWLVVVLFAVHIFLSGWLLFRHDPELLKERLTTASNVPRWDLLIKRGNRILELILLATAALDAGRFGWSVVPVAVRAIGTAALVGAVGVMYRCAAANHFLSGRSRIQSERGHTVVTTWSLSFRSASAVRFAPGPHDRTAVDVGVLDRAGTSRCARIPGRASNRAGRPHAHDEPDRLSRIRAARSRAPRARPVVTIGRKTRTTDCQFRRAFLIGDAHHFSNRSIRDFVILRMPALCSLTSVSDWRSRTGGPWHAAFCPI